MLRVRYTGEGGQYKNRSGVYADPDDPEVDVDEETAAYLVENWPFEYVDEPDQNDDVDEDRDDEEDAETCDAIKSNGERCGRELPCRYHSED